MNKKELEDRGLLPDGKLDPAFTKRMEKAIKEGKEVSRKAKGTIDHYYKKIYKKGGNE